MDTQEYIKTFNRRAYTTRAGYARMDDVLSNACILYNAALQHRCDAWKAAGRSVSFYDQCRDLTGLRQDDPYWAELHHQVARGVILRAHRSYATFFRRMKIGQTSGFPRFEPRSRFKTIQIPEARPS